MCWACDLANGDPRQFRPPGSPKQWEPRWYFLTPWDGIVCKDLQSRGYDIRLLYIPRRHVPCGQELIEDRERAKSLLARVAEEMLPDYRIVAFDLDTHSYKAHWHAQACLVRK